MKKALRDLREQNGVTLLEMARHLGTDEPAVATLELAPDMKLSEMREYCEALGLELQLSVVDGPKSAI